MRCFRNASKTAVWNRWQKNYLRLPKKKMTLQIVPWMTLLIVEFDFWQRLVTDYHERIKWLWQLIGKHLSILFWTHIFGSLMLFLTTLRSSLVKLKSNLTKNNSFIGGSILLGVSERLTTNFVFYSKLPNKRQINVIYYFNNCNHLIINVRGDAG